MKKISPVLLWGLILTIVFGAGFYSGRSNLVEASRSDALANSTDVLAATSGSVWKIPAFITGAKEKPKSAESADFGLFWKAWTLLDQKYVATHGTGTASTTVPKINPNQARVYGAIKGMVGSLGDPYTVFFDPEEADQFESQIEGNFSGVGMELGIKDNVITVIAALKNTPAEKAGMRPGDKILQILSADQKKSTQDMPVEEAVKLIRGPKGTKVTFTVLREGIEDAFEVSMFRDTITLPTLDSSYDRNTGIFTIKLYSFSAQSSALFRDALRDFVATGSNKLILDLRGNPGGYLDAAVDMASWFLPAGKVVVKEASGQSATPITEVSKGYNIFTNNLRMVILIDGGSASASEILAGALSEYNIATLVGAKTFGKGSVQELIKLDDNAAIKITVAKWFTPNGISISDGGLSPKYEVKVTPEDLKTKRDRQNEKAIELLR
jgi:carboxyl-terminal processing protease